MTFPIIETARGLWQVACEVPQFVLNRMNAFVEREQQRDKLVALVGNDEATVWLHLMGGDVQAALNLIEAGYDLQQVMDIKEGLRT